MAVVSGWVQEAAKAIDATARRVFLARMGDVGSLPSAPARTAANLVRERVIDLVAAIPIELLDTLPPEQIARILSALRPIEAIAGELRAALRPAGAEQEDKKTRRQGEA